ncbi:MAG: cell division ATPase MinD [Candidatus Woesearchaeota archaeon]|jgi:cell division ATPase MinD
MTHIVAIAGAKGGSGKTTVSINLACAINSFHRDVLVVDCNLHKPNVGIYLGFTHTPKSIHSALMGEHKITEAMYKHPSGVVLIPGNMSMDELEHLHHTEKNIQNVLNDLVDTCQIVLVDTPSGIGGEAKSIISACHKVILVTTPDMVSITDTLKTAKLAQELGKPVIGVIVNMQKKTEHEVPLSHIEGTLQAPIIGSIPYDDHIHAANANRHPVIFSNHECPATIEYKHAAANLIGIQYEYKSSEKDSLITYLLKRFGIKKPNK